MKVAACCSILALAGLPAHGGEPTTHRLEATPATVAYGYYWSQTTPVLRIASGDILDVDTLLTNTPTGLEASVGPGRAPPCHTQPGDRSHARLAARWRLVDVAAHT